MITVLHRGGGTVPQNWVPGGHFRFQPFSGIWQTKKSSVRLGQDPPYSGNARKKTFFPVDVFPKARCLFRDQNLRKRKRNPPKICKGLETETETRTSQYPWQFLERFSPDILFFSSILFLLCFSSPPENKVFSFSEYFPPFPLRFSPPPP